MRKTELIISQWDELPVCEAGKWPALLCARSLSTLRGECFYSSRDIKQILTEHLDS